MSRHIQNLERALRRARRPADRIDRQLRLARELVDSDPDRSATLRTEALAEARRIGHEGAEGRILALDVLSALHDEATSDALLRLEACDLWRARHFDSEAEMLRHVAAARLLAQRNEFTAAAESYGAAMTIAQEIDDASMIMAIFGALGSVDRSLGRYDDAERHLEQAIERARALDRPDALSSWRRQQALLEWQRGNSAAAVSTLEELLDVPEGENRSGERARAQQLLGRFLSDLGEYRDALASFLALLQFDRAPASVRSGALQGMSIVHGRLGDYEESLRYGVEFLAFVRLHDDPEREGSAENNLGNVYYRGAEYDKAEAHYQRALEIAMRTGSDTLESTCMENLANVSRDRGRFDEALDRYRRSLETSERIGDRFALATAHLNIGRLHLDRTAFDEAVGPLERARAIAEELGTRPILHQIYEELSTAHEGLGDPGEALRHHRRFVALREETVGSERQRQIDELQARSEIERARQERELIRIHIQELERELRSAVETVSALGALGDRQRALADELTGILEGFELLGEGERRAAIDRVRTRLRAVQESYELRDSIAERIELIDQGIVHALATEFPSLTSSELKVCALVRAQIPTKEIAALLSVSTRAVEKHRFSARRKLGLEAGTNLATWLGGYDT